MNGEEIDVQTLREVSQYLRGLSKAVDSLSQEVHRLSGNMVTKPEFDQFKVDVDTRLDTLRREMLAESTASTVNRWLESAIKLVSLLTLLVALGGGVATAVLYLNKVPH